MALQAIEPKYQNWMKKITPNNIYTSLIEVENKFNNILDDILYSNVSDVDIVFRTNDIRKKLLYIKIAKNLMSQKGEKITLETELNEALNRMDDNMKLIDSYERRDAVLGQKKTLDILTLITLIFLPIGVIVGYFGMNFGSMGNPTGNKAGILNVKYGQLLVFSLFFVFIGITLLIIERFYKFKFTL